MNMFWHNKKINKCKNITFLLTQDLESPSGLGRFYPLGKNLSKQGYSVNFIALHSNYASLENKLYWEDGMKISYVAQMHVIKRNDQTEYFGFLNLLRHTIIATWKLLLNLLKNPTDIIIICKPHPMNSIAGLLGGFCVGAKIILDCDDYEAASNYFTSSWQKHIIKLFENLMPILVHHITTNTIYNKERMINQGIQDYKIDYIPNGVDRERFLITDNNYINSIRTKFNLQEQKVITYIGSLSLSNHPVDLLLESFQIINNSMLGVKLLIVGGGKDLPALIKLAEELGISEQTIFIGRVSSNLVANYYRVADVSIDPVYDTDAAKGRCPLKVFESWITETPFVTADVGDRKKLAGSPQATLLAKPGDSIDLANKILEVLNNPNLAENLIVQGKKRIIEYLWDELGKKYYRIIDKVCL